ncbi:ATPase ASNA1-like protein [Morus notabilis]|uniref:ATPase ASNA1-like protein n=1 Tax=Morus notabilis TaxID=981085 RepID=W9QZI6_9ROSA|nr:ATPase ASNA1-like protein [Morus notabilis]
MAADSELPEGTVQNILEQESLKWVFVGGKGGVGKTTCSSILSILLSTVRSSVLIISTDPAHNLSDAFQQRFTKTPTLVNGFSNLYAMEVDPTVENEEGGGTEGMDSLVSELANAIPGIDEAMSFAEMLKLVQTMDYSVIVFDTAPTGHTLRLLQFPSTLEKGLAKIMSLKSKFGGMISQMTRLFGVDDEFGEEAILGKLEGMKDVIEQVNRQFKDPDLTTFVCVCIPEFLSLYETERLVQELTKFEIDTHNIIINQVLYDEEDVESKLLKARMRMQQKYVDQFYMLYDDFHITKLPLLPQELRCQKDLNRFLHEFRVGPKMYKISLSKDGGSVRIEESELEFLHFLRVRKVTRINGGAVRRIILPGDSKKTRWKILMNKLNRLMGRASFFKDNRKA